MDSDYEDLLAQRAKTLVTIQHLVVYIQSLITSVKTDLEEQQSHNKDERS